MSYFRFIRLKNGLTSFAAVELELVPVRSPRIEWSESLSIQKRYYSDAVKLGVEDAVRWHSPEAVGLFSFRVTQLQEVLVDTKSDAVRCAATAAAWEALGNDPNALDFIFSGKWTAKCRTLKIEETSKDAKTSKDI